VPHRARPAHNERHPVHVTLRVGGRLPSLREQVLFLGLRRALAKASRSAFRVVHYSVQADHVHLIVEAHDKTGLSRGMAGLEIRLARSLNGNLGRRGRVFGDRYHARTLRTPRETRNAIVYVLMNFKKHARVACEVDVCSSAFWFDGWTTQPSMRDPPAWNEGDDVPVRLPRTWLARDGWRRHGLIAPSERPRLV
jgi:REP-associated tyrosine transposase